MKLFIWYLHFHKFNQVTLIKILNKNSIENENKNFGLFKKFNELSQKRKIFYNYKLEKNGTMYK